MLRQTLYLWKQAPFLRLVIPLMAGILLQWYCAPEVKWGWIGLITGIAGVIIFNLGLSFYQYKFGWINGLFINGLFLALGMLITWSKNISHQQEWMNNYYRGEKSCLITTLEEPLSEKANSFKANASVEQIIQGNTIQSVKGNIIIYFKKDSALKHLGYGSRIMLSKLLQPVKNTGNPGSFDYERYTSFQGIYQQVWLSPGEYILLPGSSKNWLTAFLFASRQKVLHMITMYIPGEKEAGLAEALLVGYKDDLDKSLVQSYSNTGVVHVIAISGMHLGLIYWLLTKLLSPLKKRKHTRWAMPVLIITGLWLFALLAGGGPSILRSAVMFTCIVVGENLERKTFIYNSLAASAFILLCLNPFWLWDAGFQLSYTAVLSIIIFMKPIYNWLYFQNKLIDHTWKLMAISLAAQVLTTPVSIYYFHQFPIYFLITNLVAVPLSSLIVLLEIVLCSTAFLPAIAKSVGLLLHWLIYCLNSFIEHMEGLPFALWNSLQINTLQALFMYGIITAIAYWLLQKNKTALLTGLAFLLSFFCLRTWSFISARQQQQLIVYNVPKHQCIDFIQGRSYFFQGDRELFTDNALQNFYLRPSRILHRMDAADSIATLLYTLPVFIFNNKKIVLVDRAYNYHAGSSQMNADLIIISKNPPLQLAQLTKFFNCSQFVFDGSNSVRKGSEWKEEAAKLGVNCFFVVDNGAFVMNLE